MERPGEDEVACAMRLLERVLRDYPRAFEVVVADELYLRADFFNFVTRQGKEVSVFLKLIAEAYQSDKPASLCDPKRPVYIYTDGDLVPFALRIRDRKTNLAILNTVVPALYLKAHPTKDARGKGREFEMWTASFLDVSEKTREKGLIALAHDSLSWSMIPLIIDLGLPIGTIRGVLSDMRIVSPTPAPRAGDTPPNPSGTPPRAATSSKPQS